MDVTARDRPFDLPVGYEDGVRQRAELARQVRSLWSAVAALSAVCALLLVAVAFCVERDPVLRSLFPHWGPAALSAAALVLVVLLGAAFAEISRRG